MDPCQWLWLWMEYSTNKAGVMTQASVYIEAHSPAGLEVRDEPDGPHLVDFYPKVPQCLGSTGDGGGAHCIFYMLYVRYMV